MSALIRMISVAVIGGALTALFSAAACNECDGIMIHGECQKPCREELCPAGQHCFDNTCRAPCTSVVDCRAGQQCKDVITEYNFEGRLCIGGDEQKTTTAGGSCNENDDCDLGSGYHCIQGKCTLTCEIHEHCGSTGSCTKVVKDVEGKSVRVCAPDDFPRAEGQYGSLCPFGNVNHDECASDFVCVGAGPGDIDAYCTKLGCADDSECPSGFYCGRRRTSAESCNDVCGLGASTSTDCIADSDMGPGRPYQCGPISLIASICLLRSFCNSCETDADCLGRPNQICAKDRSGAKICTVLCDKNYDSCPWGNAAICGRWDEGLGKDTCAHRFGQCIGDGSSCHPCVDETDCPNGFCAEEPFTGERFCVDLSAACSCPEGTESTCAGGGCPLTPEPASETMACFGGANYAGSVYENRCVGASESEGCWPSL